MPQTRRQVMATGLAAAMIATGARADEKVTIRVASFSPGGGVINTTLLPVWLDKVKADSDGTFDYQVFPGGVLGRNPTEQLKLVRDGVADMAFVVPDFTPGEMTGWGVYGIPGLLQTGREGSRAMQIAVERGLLSAPDGIVPVGIFGSGINKIHSSKPINSLADLKGLRIQSSSKAQLEAIQRLGASPTPNIRGPESADAISRGVIDAALMDYGAYHSFRVSEVAPYHLELPMGGLSLMFPLNAGTWDRLAPAAKAAFQKHGFAAFADFGGGVLDDQDAALRQEYLAKPDQSAMDITEAVRAEFDALMTGVETAWIEGDADKQKVYDGFIDILAELRSA